MSRLILVRHGQASFLSDDYDKLSTLGQRQARQLGTHWQEQGLICDKLVCGPRLRHRETANAVRDNTQPTGPLSPTVMEVPGLDEHHVDQLLLTNCDQLARHSRQLERLISAFHNAKTVTDKHRSFQRLFESTAQLWLEGKHFEVESLVDFRARVHRALDDLIDQPRRGQIIAAFTSVGPITVALQRAMQCSDQVALQTGWRLRNCSVTQFAFSGKRFTLDHFNSLAHLHKTDWTYR